MLHYSLFPPLCKKSENECGRKILENILKWKKLADFLSSMCTVKTLKWPTTSSNQSHMLSAEPSTWLCTTQAQFFPWFKNVNDLMLENPGGTKKHSHARRCTTMYTTPALNKKKKIRTFMCFTVAATILTLQLKGIWSCQDHFQVPWLILTELFCCRMHLTAEGGTAEAGSAEASGCMVKAVQQWSYKMVIPYSCWAQQLSGKRKEKPSADCSIWQLELILLKTLSSPGAHVPSLRHYHWDAWMPPHSFSHDKSLFVSVWQD